MPRLFLALGLAAALPVLTAAQSPAPVLTLTLAEALERARANAQELLTADLAARIAHEDRVQNRAALFPTLIWLNGFAYTQPNGPDNSLTFVANDGPRLFINQAWVHADVYAPSKLADFRASIAAEAVARARVDITARGITQVVVQNFYGMAAAQRKFQNAKRSLEEAQRFVDITTKQEAGGEAAHSDVVKAQLTLYQRQRDLQDAQLAYDKVRIGFAVLLFRDFRQDFEVADDLDSTKPMAAFPEIEAQAQNNNPEIRAAQSAVTQQNFGIKSARAGYLPQLGVDYYYGLQARQYAVQNEFGQNNLGNYVAVNLNVPVWNWGSTRSKVRQAGLRLEQAQNELTLANRQLQSNLNAFYLEANVASGQIQSLKQSLDSSEESLKLTMLRYEAGEVSVLEVVDAQNTLLAARNAYVDGLARYHLALAALQTLTGTL